MEMDLAERLARLALGHVGREYPHGLAHVLEEPEEIRPSSLHPAFYGSYDWHSCVHGWWSLTRLLRLFPDLPSGEEIRAQADATLTPERIAGEVAYFERHPAFERPYGWAWLLALHSELSRHDAPWAGTVEPLARLLAVRFGGYLERLDYPVRHGVHSNSAFALVLVHAWAEAYDPPLAGTVATWAATRFGDDRACADHEPSGSDFLSPTLMEALLMARVLPAGSFSGWQERFLPELPPNLRAPARVSDRTDGQIGHLDGLNLSRAWCLRSLAPYLPGAAEAAERHLQAALPHLADDYAGEHWLATFALLALTENQVRRGG